MKLVRQFLSHSSKLGHVSLPRSAPLKPNGYSAVQLGFDEVKPKRLTGGELGHLKKNDMPPLRFLREFRAKNIQVKEGEQVTVSLFVTWRTC